MSLEETYSDENIFAKIIRGEIPSVKLIDDPRVLGFMDAFPQSVGHCLIISKSAKSVNLLDLPAEDLADVMAATQRLARAVTKALSPDGVRIAQFNGAPAGQTVFHTHFHVIPVYEGQSLGGHGEGQADPAALEDTAAKIRAALD